MASLPAAGTFMISDLRPECFTSIYKAIFFCKGLRFISLLKCFLIIKRNDIKSSRGRAAQSSSIKSWPWVAARLKWKIVSGCRFSFRSQFALRCSSFTFGTSSMAINWLIKSIGNVLSAKLAATNPSFVLNLHPMRGETRRGVCWSGWLHQGRELCQWAKVIVNFQAGGMITPLTAVQVHLHM